MAALPADLTKVNFDQGTDDPSQAQSELAGNVDKSNVIIAYLSALFGTDGTAPTARSTMGLGAVATLGIGNGVEDSGGNLQINLDGVTLALGASGIKLNDNSVGTAQLVHQARGSIITFGASNVPAILAAGTSGFFLKSLGAGNDLAYAAAASTVFDFQSFTSAGGATWDKPAGIDADALVMAFLIGGGGGGGKNTGGNDGGGGGAGGTGLLVIFKASILGGSESLNIGSGGAGRTGSTGNGSNGGASTFGSLAWCGGGGGGKGLFDANFGGSIGEIGKTGAIDNMSAGLSSGAGGGRGDEACSDPGEGRDSMMGGGGGGGGGEPGGGSSAGGKSLLAGDGGAGADSAANAGAGVAPGGGGGGSQGGNGGGGAAGRILVWTMG